MKSSGRPDFFLISIILILTGAGLVTIYSSSAIYALDRFGSSTYFLWRQCAWILIGVVVAFPFILYDHKKLKPWIKPLLFACFVFLILVLVFGREVSGAKRWLRIGGIGFQPSELTKLVLILFVADYCDRKRSRLQNFRKGLVPLLAVIAVFCGLIFVQPDLGTPLLIASTCITIIFIGGGKWSQLAGLGSVVILLGGLAAWLEPYRRRRLLSFLNPWEHARGDSYQLVQSLLALGSGGFTGVGLGGSHSKLLYLPEPHTDFVFPIYAEELGVVGSWTLLLLFGLVAWSGFRIASRSTNLFSALTASGITLMILYQTIFNIAMVTGCLPTKGLPLPFLSFGGSSLVVTLMSFGILLNISRTARITK